MDELDNILAEIGVSTEQPQTPSSPAVQSVAADVFDEVLSEMGFPATETPVESSEEIEEEEETQEVSDGRTYNPTDYADVEYNIEVAPATPMVESGRRVLEAINHAVESARTSAPEPVQEEEDNHIEPNSPTLLMDATTSRFSGAEWYNEIQKKSVILAGLGGIGSYVAFQLARMNIAKLVLYDDDIVEAANMSGQFYGTDSIGINKANAMCNIISNYTSMRNVYAIAEKFTSQSETGNIMICGFDSMKARSMYFYSWCEHVDKLPQEEKMNCLFIDGRLSIDLLQVLCIRGDDEYSKHRYEQEYLFSDREAEATVCSLKQTTYLACMIGSVIVNLFTNWVAGLLNPIIPYDLPFFTAYNAQNMLFKTEN